MSRERLTQLEVQYNACAMQLETQQVEHERIRAEITQAQNEFNNKAASLQAAQSRVKELNNTLKQLESENKILVDNLTKEKEPMNKLTSLLSEYNEYIPTASQPVLNVTKVGETAAFINDSQQS